MNREEILNALHKSGRATATNPNGVYCEFIAIRTQEAERVRLVATYGGHAIVDMVFQFSEDAIDYAETLKP